MVIIRVVDVVWVGMLLWIAAMFRLNVRLHQGARQHKGNFSLEKLVRSHFIKGGSPKNENDHFSSLSTNNNNTNNKNNGNENNNVPRADKSYSSKNAKTHGFFLVGMHRSGTSLVAGSFHRFGYSVLDTAGSLKGATEFNPKGYYELESLVQQNTAWLTEQRVHWAYGHGEFDPTKATKLDDTGFQTLKSINNHNNHNNATTTTTITPWVLKDPRLCITLKAWDRHLGREGQDDALTPAVFLYRHPLSVGLSMCQRSKTELFFALKSWAFHNIQAIQNLKGRCFVTTNLQAWVDDDDDGDNGPAKETLRISSKLYHSCGIPIPPVNPTFEQEVTDFVSKSLLRHQYPQNILHESQEQQQQQQHQEQYSQNDKISGESSWSSSSFLIVRKLFDDCSFPRPYDVTDLNIRMLDIAIQLYEDMESGAAFKTQYKFPDKLPRMKGGIIERKMKGWQRPAH